MRRPETKSKPAPANAPAPQTVQPRIPVWVLAALLVLVTIALYWPATSCDFINYDDDLYVTSNAHVQSGLTLENVKWAFSNTVAGNWHPLTMFSHMLDCQLFGLNPWGHHLTNVLFHALNAALVFLLLRQLSGATWRSLWVAALFAVHPLHVESVAWVAERKDVLNSFFGLLTLIFYVRYAQTKQTFNSQPSTLNYFLALFFFALGLLSKPMLVTWPFVMLLLDYWPLGRLRTPDFARLRYASTRAEIRLAAPEPKAEAGLRTSRSLPPFITRHAPILLEKLPFFVLAAMASCVTFEVQRRGGAFGMVEHLPLGARVGNALISYCRYLGKLFWPTDLAVFYPHPGHWPVAQVLLAGGLILGITVLFIANRRQYPFLLMGWLWFVGTLVPVIGLVQVGGQAMADRYTYMPSLGVLIMAIWGAHELVRRWLYLVIALSVAGLAVIVLCLALTRQQLGYWQDSESLFRHALAVTKNNYLAHNNLGVALAARGRFDEAIGNFRKAIQFNSNRPEIFVRLGMALDQLGRTREAVAQYREALKLNPNLVGALNNLAWVLAASPDDQLRNGAEAVRLAERACELTHYAQPLFIGTLAAAYAEAGRFPEAVATAEKAERLATDAGLTAVAAKNRQLLELYRAGKPYHEPAPIPQK